MHRTVAAFSKLVSSSSSRLAALMTIFRAVTATLRWLVIALVIAVVAGTGSALLLVTLDAATRLREAAPLFIWAMPAAGAVTVWAYARFGGRAAQGNGAIFAELATPSARLPLRMAPMILAGTAIAHLTGASVGREGTAVQMASPLADALTKVGSWTAHDRRVLLSAAMAGGFASVFGTPLAGMIFGLEVRRVGTVRYDALLACLVAAVGANAVTDAWGIHHSTYAVGLVPLFSIRSAFGAAGSGVLFGIAAMVFVRLSHAMARAAGAVIPNAPLRAAAGGLAVLGVVGALGTDRHLGLSVPLIHAAFAGPVATWDFAAKLLLTSVCLAAGFRGGEVTPLFAVGATLGNAIAPLFGMPIPLVAAMGFVATFAGASNAPLASIVAGIELFGTAPASYLAIACVVSYLCTGASGMYPGQVVDQPKHVLG